MSSFTVRTPAQREMPKRASLGRMVNQSTVMLMTCIGALILILALLILFHENANATKGYSLRRLENERSVLLLEQEVLNMQIAEAQALEHLQNDPQILKMVPYTKPRYVEPEPLTPPPPPPAPPAPAAVLEGSGSLSVSGATL